MSRVAIVSAVRSAVGKHVGQWAPVSEAQLVTEVISEAIKRAGIDPAEVDDVILGNVQGERGNIARLAALTAGCPIETPAYNLDRQCGSGSQAIANAAMMITCGVADVVVAGGVEHMTRSPHQLMKTATPYEYAAPKFVTRVYAPLDRFEPLTMPQTADKLAKMHGVTREDCDKFALESHKKASKAIKEGVFKDQIVPIEVKTRKLSYVGDTDECVRHDVSLDAMAKLPPLFTDGYTTAGSSSPRSDGAGVLVLMAEQIAKARDLKIIGYIKDFTAIGVDPTIMGYGPVPAVEKLLKKTGMSIKDIDLMELNEAFAAQAIPCIRNIGLDPAKINPNGGAIAVGHPLGGTGAVLATKLLYEMERKDYQFGIVTMCIGGGQGFATLFERV